MNLPARLVSDAAELSRLTGHEVNLEPEGNQILAIAAQAALPGGTYSRSASDVLLITDFQYPMSAMDMFYMEVEVQHANGSIPSHASSIETHGGRQWRRWSWHRNGIWQPNVDGLISHWAFVEACWAKESTA